MPHLTIGFIYLLFILWVAKVCIRHMLAERREASRGRQ